MSKVTFKSVTLRNFMSFGNVPTTVQLDTRDTALIIGNNRDEGQTGLSSNGSGKSNIFQAMFWCLFDTGISKIKQDGFINFTNGKQLEVKVEMDIDGDTYVVTRTRKPTGVTLEKNGKSFTLHSTSNTDDDICELLSVNANVFLSTNIMDANVEPFMAKGGADQRNFMEVFLDLILLSKRAERVKALAKDNAIELKLEEQRLSNVMVSNDRLRANILSLTKKSAEFEDTAKRQYETLSKELEELKLIDIARDRQINRKIAAIDEELRIIQLEVSKLENTINMATADLNMVKSAEHTLSEAEGQVAQWEVNRLQEIERLMTLQAKLPDVDTQLIIDAYTRIDQIEQEKRNLAIEQDKIRAREANRREKIAAIETEISGIESGVCHYCNQPFFSHDKKQAAEHKRLDLLEEMEVDEHAMDKLDAAVKVLDKELEELREAMTGLPTLKEAKNIAGERSALQIDIDRQNRMDNPYERQIETAKAKLESLKSKDEIQAVIQENIAKAEEAATKMDTLSEQREALVLQDAIPMDRLSAIESRIQSLTHNLAGMEHQQNPYLEQIAMMEGQIEEVSNDKLEELAKRDTHFKTLTKLLTDNKSFVRRNLIDQYVPYINQRLTYYLDKLQSMLSVQINSDLSVDIEYMNHPISYGNLSKGERLRLNFATSMSFIDMNRMLGKSFNVMAIDEFMDGGSDAWFFHTAFSIIREKSDTSIMIISHRDEIKEMVDRIIEVTKERGFSTVEERLTA